MSIRSVAAAALALAVSPALLSAQAGRFPPDSLRNVQVLPRTLTPIQVVGQMRNFTFALGVRCQYCHLGEEGQDLATFDFASDDKPAKRVAREMLRMVQGINQQTLASLPRRQTPPVEVTCETCHRGVTVPRQLVDVLIIAQEAGGADSAARAYRALRQRYYGTAAYDFTDRTLNTLAGRLARQQRYDDALAAVRLNQEFHPQSAAVRTTAGDVHRMRGDTAAAVAAYREALQLDSTEATARGRLRQLGQRP